MCGVTGYLLQAAEWPAPRGETVASSMVASLAHRGPDDRGVWFDEETGVALGHSRLSIQDLSAAGHQPMVSNNGRWVLSYNGEIYNTDDLRRVLTGPFRGRSDTEVLLQLIERSGVEGAVREVNGMFAFAAWDRATRTLWLARDRGGEKPLYYGCARGTFLFGSELKAIRRHPHFAATVDRDALATYFEVGYVPSPFAIYEGVHKLPPGCTLSVSVGSAASAVIPKPYWSASDVALSATSCPQELAIDDLDDLLLDAVRRRMVSDVPLGALLSGGVDSSLVVAMMQRASSSQSRTFTIGFAESQFDESSHARAVARHLHTNHTELVVGPSQALEVIPQITATYDEPFADSSQIPTMLVCALARRSVTVALSGDGGDELFGGYSRYLWWNSLWNRRQKTPEWLRPLASAMMRRPSPRTWLTAQRVFRGLGALSGPQLPQQARKAAEILDAPTASAAYLALTAVWPAASGIVVGGRGHDRGPAGGVGFSTFVEEMMCQDFATYLPDDILVKVDRASMAHSLEVRPPFLDHRIVEAAWRLPLSRKVHDGRGKLALREVLYRYVPADLIERPKSGFALPITDWLRGPLRAWAEELLSPTRLRSEGFLNPGPVREIWGRHLKGKVAAESQIWAVLMFQSWLADVHRSQEEPPSGARRVDAAN